VKTDGKRTLFVMALFLAVSSPAREAHARAHPEEVEGGRPLTADDVARRAAETSYSAKAAEQSVASAAAGVDAAWLAWLPRLTGTARYTRHSDFTPPALSFGSGPPVAIPLVLDQWSFQASVVVPLSDYAFKVATSVEAAEHVAEASRYDLAAARARSWTDGKLAYLAWLTARAGLDVAEVTLELQKGILADAKGQLAVGNASTADVLQSEAAVAAAELAVARAKNLVHVAERQVRIAIHATPGERFAPGSELESEPGAQEGSLDDMLREARSTRYELKSLERRSGAALGEARVARAVAYPSVSAFGEAVYANPNARRFPPRDEWFGTWAVGVQLTWSPNDLFLGGAGGRAAEARAVELEARKQALLDAIDLEVTQAYEALAEARAAVATSERQIASAAEAHRVTRELFAHGRATATQVREADTALTRARLDAVHARALAQTSSARLEHAVGRAGARVASTR
jgi:outer membrane protein